MGGLDTNAAGWGVAPEPLLLFLAAMLIEALWPTRWRPAPLSGGVPRLFVRLTGLLARRLDRPGRSAGKMLFRGIFIVLLLGILAAAAGIAITALVRFVPFAWLLEFAVLLATVRLRRP